MLAETRLVSEWIAATYPGREWHLQFRVGANPQSVGLAPGDEEEVRLLRNLNRRVDAVIAPPPDVVIVEAKMWDPTTAIGRLLEYRLLLPATPDVQKWGGAPVTAVLLTAQHDHIAEVLCRDQGIRYVWWEPEWIADFYAKYPERRRKMAFPGLVDELVRRQGNVASEPPLT